jgi:hypothetical protein
VISILQGAIVVPHVVQELLYRGLIRKCESQAQIRITRRGKNRANRTIEENANLILEILAAIRREDAGKVSLGGLAIQELTFLTPIEITTQSRS